MHLRLLLILTLLAQPLTWPFAIGAADSSACTASGCCEVVESTSCCGTVERSMQCGKTGGECRCGIVPGEPVSSPPAPRPTERQDIGPFVAMPAVASAFVSTTLHPRQQQTQVVRRLLPDPQALLCIWRT